MRILHRSFFSIHLIWLTAGLALVACGTKGDKASSSPLEIPKQAFEVPPEVPSVTEPDTGHKPSEGKEQKLLRLEPSGELLAAGVRQSERHRPPKQVLLVTPNTSLRVIVRAIQNSDGLATDSLGVESSTTGKTLPLPRGDGPKVRVVRRYSAGRQAHLGRYRVLGLRVPALPWAASRGAAAPLREKHTTINRGV